MWLHTKYVRNKMISMLRAATDMSDEIIYYKVHLVSLLINIHDPILCTSPEQEYSIIWLQHNKKCVLTEPQVNKQAVQSINKCERYQE